MIGHSFLTLNRLSSIVFSGSGATSECFAISSLSCRQRSCIACWSPPRNHLAFHLGRISSESIYSVSSQDVFSNLQLQLFCCRNEKGMKKRFFCDRDLIEENEVSHIFRRQLKFMSCLDIPLWTVLFTLFVFRIFTRFLFDYRGYHDVYMWPVNFLFLLVCLGSKCWYKWHCNIIHIIRT